MCHHAKSKYICPSLPSIQQSQDHWLRYRSQHEAESARKSWRNILIWFWCPPFRISESISRWSLTKYCCKSKLNETNERTIQKRRGSGRYRLDGDELEEEEDGGGLGGKMERGVRLCWARTPPLDRVSGSLLLLLYRHNQHHRGWSSWSKNSSTRSSERVRLRLNEENLGWTQVECTRKALMIGKS